MKPNSTTKTMSATQLTFCIASPGVGQLRLSGRKVDQCRENGAHDHPQHLIPVKERHSVPGRLGAVVEGRPEHPDELQDKKQVPPAPARASVGHFIHSRPSSSVGPITA